MLVEVESIIHDIRIIHPFSCVLVGGVSPSGALVQLSHPDFSMPFNVIAFSSTLVAFFFGSVSPLSTFARAPLPFLCFDALRPRNTPHFSGVSRAVLANSPV